MVKPAVVAAVALRNSRRPMVRVFCVMRALRSQRGEEDEASWDGSENEEACLRPVLRILLA
jgi:hypothetical protein